MSSDDEFDDSENEETVGLLLSGQNSKYSLSLSLTTSNDKNVLLVSDIFSGLGMSIPKMPKRRILNKQKTQLKMRMSLRTLFSALMKTIR